jgi:hypothetical protein
MFTSRPPASSWVNQVERFFANLTEKQIRRGAHRSTAELEAADPSLSRRGQCRPKAFQMDQIRRRHSRRHQALLSQNLEIAAAQAEIARN